jgi:hypothetical protein
VSAAFFWNSSACWPAGRAPDWRERKQRLS